jgi:hypothetical protein
MLSRGENNRFELKTKKCDFQKKDKKTCYFINFYDENVNCRFSEEF